MTNTPDYIELNRQLDALLTGQHDLIANAAQLASFVFYNMPDVNWVGFYFIKDGRLLLGPFQGKVACFEIAVGRGVCGHVVQSREAIIVDDVHDFTDHIACDSASNAEMVFPVIVSDDIKGVFDLDSPKFNRFTQTDLEGVKLLLDTFIKHTEF